MLIGSGSKVPLKRDSRAASASVLVIIPTAIWPSLDSAPTTKKGSSTQKGNENPIGPIHASHPQRKPKASEDGAQTLCCLLGRRPIARSLRYCHAASSPYRARQAPFVCFGVP